MQYLVLQYSVDKNNFCVIIMFVKTSAVSNMELKNTGEYVFYAESNYSKKQKYSVKITIHSNGAVS